ncbi:replication-relaxation family protein [Streptomyces sp. NBC_01261]|uniref:replication-relaxation family protein n=1 Tax=Streptomyces sp. NBC_01261 TaxID=2903802 RepID=UPI002E32AE17|nr:replication-relaxation family protein [Streptomyces sp. NBC_01261]
MAQVITAEDKDGRSYVRRAMSKLAELGLAEMNGKDGKHPIWNLAPAGQKALADGNELPSRPKVGTGAKAVRAGFGPHGVAVTDTILAYGNRRSLTDWQVEVNHAIKGDRPELQHRGRPRPAHSDQRGPPLRTRQRPHVPGPPREGGLRPRALRRAPRLGGSPRHHRPHVPVLAVPPLHPLGTLPAAARRPCGQGGAPARQPRLALTADVRASPSRSG